MELEDIVSKYPPKQIMLIPIVIIVLALISLGNLSQHRLACKAGSRVYWRHSCNSARDRIRRCSVSRV